MKTIQNKDERTWLQESNVRLNSLMEAYYLARRGIPRTPTKIKFPHHNSEVIVPGQVPASQIAREISNAFFLLLKGLTESRLKASGFDADWRDAQKFYRSIGLSDQSIENSGEEMFASFCVIRNCIAHNYGLVDEKTKQKMDELTLNQYIEIGHTALENWFKFSRHVFELTGSAISNRDS